MSAMVMPVARSEERPAPVIKKRFFLKPPVKADVDFTIKQVTNYENLAERVRLRPDPDGFAARVVKRSIVSRPTFAPIREGDIVIPVNGVDECALTRTAIDYMQVRHRAGEAVTPGVIRNGERRQVKLRLYRNPAPRSLRRARHIVLGLLRHRYGYNLMVLANAA